MPCCEGMTVEERQKKCCSVNLFKSAMETTLRLAEDSSKATAEQKEERLAICRECEFLNAEKMVCMKCGCWLELKTQFANMSCPIGKWTEVNNV